MPAKINLFSKIFSKYELARHSLVMFAATIFAGIFNYLYQVYMGRVMGPEEYGVFGALLAIFFMIGVISQTANLSLLLVSLLYTVRWKNDIYYSTDI